MNTRYSIAFKNLFKIWFLWQINKLAGSVAFYENPKDISEFSKISNLEMTTKLDLKMIDSLKTITTNSHVIDLDNNDQCKYIPRYNETSVINFVKSRASITPFNFFLYCLGNCFNPYKLLFNFQSLLLILLIINFLILLETFIKIFFSRFSLRNAAKMSTWCNSKLWKTAITRIIYSVINFRTKVKVSLKSSLKTCEKLLVMISIFHLASFFNLFNFFLQTKYLPTAFFLFGKTFIQLKTPVCLRFENLVTIAFFHSSLLGDQRIFVYIWGLLIVTIKATNIFPISTVSSSANRPNLIINFLTYIEDFHISTWVYSLWVLTCSVGRNRVHSSIVQYRQLAATYLWCILL